VSEAEKKTASKADKRASKRLTGTEIVALVGGGLLALGVFLPWYNIENKRGSIDAVRGPADLTGWEVHDIQRYLWLAAAIAPFILAYIILRGHKLSWARGEMTAVTAIAAFGLLVYAGLINRPGDPRSLTSLKWGWLVALAGIILMVVGSALRASETERARKPPGVL
jgi:hypothetical protein